MSKFKVGDIAWSPYSGFLELEQGNHSLYWIIHGRNRFDENGRDAVDHKHPTLLTVEEAAKLGYFPESNVNEVCL